MDGHQASLLGDGAWAAPVGCPRAPCPAGCPDQAADLGAPQVDRQVPSAGTVNSGFPPTPPKHHMNTCAGVPLVFGQRPEGVFWCPCIRRLNEPQPPPPTNP